MKEVRETRLAQVEEHEIKKKLIKKEKKICGRSASLADSEC